MTPQRQYTVPDMPNDNHSHPLADDIIQRLEALEIKASFTEDLLDQLNMTIYQQQQLIDRLTHEVIQLRQQAPEGGSNSPRNLRDELPPHY